MPWHSQAFAPRIHQRLRANGSCDSPYAGLVVSWLLACIRRLPESLIAVTDNAADPLRVAAHVTSVLSQLGVLYSIASTSPDRPTVSV